MRFAYAADRKTLLAIAACALMLAFAVYARLYYLEFKSADYHYFVHRWINFIRDRGVDAYGVHFSNYAPLYTYMLGVASLVPPVPDVSPLYIAKGLTLAGDVALAILFYNIVLRHGGDMRRAWLAACAVLASPSFIVNGFSAVQCDVFYAAFMVACVYMLYRQRPLAALVWFGLAYSFKQQAIFLTPFLLVFLLRRRIPWKFIWVPAAVYVALTVPSWLLGRPMMDLLTVYTTQFRDSVNLGNAGNFYSLMGPCCNDYSRQITYAALALTTMTALCIGIITARRWPLDATLLHYVLLASFITALMPFLLPKMLDRYFYSSEVMALLLACLRPRWFIFALMLQFSSLNAYPRFQFHTLIDVTGWDFAQRHLIASLLNAAAIIGLGRLCYLHIWLPPARRAL